MLPPSRFISLNTTQLPVDYIQVQRTTEGTNIAARLQRPTDGAHLGRGKHCTLTARVMEPYYCLVQRSDTFRVSMRFYTKPASKTLKQLCKPCSLVAWGR